MEDYPERIEGVSRANVQAALTAGEAFLTAARSTDDPLYVALKGLAYAAGTVIASYARDAQDDEPLVQELRRYGAGKTPLSVQLHVGTEEVLRLTHAILVNVISLLLEEGKPQVS